MAMVPMLPRATRAQVLAAVSALDADAVDRLAVDLGLTDQGRLAGELGVDMRHVETLYELRSLISWQGLQTDLRNLVKEGNLVRRTEEDWHRVTRRRLFQGSPSPTTWAYCTPEGARAVRDATVARQS